MCWTIETGDGRCWKLPVPALIEVLDWWRSTLEPVFDAAVPLLCYRKDTGSDDTGSNDTGSKFAQENMYTIHVNTSKKIPVHPLNIKKLMLKYLELIDSRFNVLWVVDLCLVVRLFWPLEVAGNSWCARFRFRSFRTNLTQTYHEVQYCLS